MSLLNDNRFHVLLALALTSLLTFAYARLRRTERHITTPSILKNAKSSLEQEYPLAAYYAISPLSDFDWKSTPPIKLRPFKPNYHLTMGECLNRPPLSPHLSFLAGNVD